MSTHAAGDPLADLQGRYAAILTLCTHARPFTPSTDTEALPDDETPPQWCAIREQDLTLPGAIVPPITTGERIEEARAYSKERTRENGKKARFVYLCDPLPLLLQLQSYINQGIRDAAKAGLVLGGFEDSGFTISRATYAVDWNAVLSEWGAVAAERLERLRLEAKRRELAQLAEGTRPPPAATTAPDAEKNAPTIDPADLIHGVCFADIWTAVLTPGKSTAHDAVKTAIKLYAIGMGMREERKRGNKRTLVYNHEPLADILWNKYSDRLTVKRKDTLKKRLASICRDFKKADE